jgi:hypothetical protein
MSLDELKMQLGLLLSAVVEAAAKNSVELQRLRGIALYDTQKDLFITSLEPFAGVEAGVRGLPLVHERYGVEAARRIALQLVYEYFGRMNGAHVDSASLDALWSDFIVELETAMWLTRSVTNLRHFRSGNLTSSLETAFPSTAGTQPRSLVLVSAMASGRGLTRTLSVLAQAPSFSSRTPRRQSGRVTSFLWTAQEGGSDVPAPSAVCG